MWVKFCFSNGRKTDRQRDRQTERQRERQKNRKREIRDFFSEGILLYIKLSLTEDCSKLVTHEYIESSLLQIDVYSHGKR